MIEIIKILPLQNCGKCGYASCGAYAKAMTDSNASPYLCPNLEKEKAEKIKEILAR